jgi:hypothetical protein
MNEKFGNVDITNTQLSNYGFNIPCFYKDKNGETVLFVGSEFGELYVYDQIDNNLDGSFRLLGILPGIKEGWRSGVAVGNLNNDTLTDIMVGNYSGGMGLFFGKGDKIFGINDHVANEVSKLVITPNPAGNHIVISLSNELSVNTESIVIQCVDGKIIETLPGNILPLSLDVSGFKNGIYLVVVQTSKGMLSGKLIINR